MVFPSRPYLSPGRESNIHEGKIRAPAAAMALIERLQK
jgi:hypothetical protein